MRSCIEGIIGLAACMGFSFLTVGCATFGAGTPDAKAMDWPIYTPLTGGANVTIEIITVNNVCPPREAIERAVEGYEQLIFDKTVQVVEGGNASVDLGVDGAMSLSDIELIIGEAFFQAPSSILLIVAPHFEFFTDNMGEYRAPYLSIPERAGPHLVLVSAESVKDILHVPGIFSLEDAWRYVIIHELCHTLGIPSSKAHMWAKRHCTQPECVLYPPGGDPFFLLRTLVTLGPPFKPCKTCRGEIVASQTVECSETSVPFDYFDRLVALNPDNPRAIWERMRRASEQRDYEKALRDCVKLVELDARNAQTQFALGATYWSLGDSSSAKLALEAAISIDRTNTRALNLLARILATDAIDSNRNGQLAIELAESACVITEWKDSNCVATLACGYAEIGDFESAKAYIAKAVETDNGDNSEEYAGYLESFRQQRPHRNCDAMNGVKL